MSGAKGAVIGGAYAGGGPVIGAASSGGAVAAGGAALTGGVIVIGAAVVVGTIAAAKAAELKYHKNAVKQCSKKFNDIIQCATIKTWATSDEWAKLENCQQKFNQIQVSDDLAQARAANSQAAELLREAENAAKPAILRDEIMQAGKNMRLMLSEGKRPDMLAGQEPLLSKIEQLSAEVSRKKEMNVSAGQKLRREQLALRKQCENFKNCVLKFDELSDYFDAIKQYDWAKNISVAICDELANRPALTVEQIKGSFAQLLKQADSAFDQYRQAQDNNLVDLQNLREEIEQGRVSKLELLNANQVYKCYCQDIIFEINDLIKKTRYALYNDDSDTVKECLSQFDQLVESLPKTAKAREEQAEQMAELVAIKLEQIALILRQLTELSNNLDLPESIQDEYDIPDLDSRIMDLGGAKPNEETLKQAAKLESEIEIWMKRLPILKLHYSARSLFKSLVNEDFKVDDDSLEELELEAGEEEDEWRLLFETESGEKREFVYVLEDDKLKLSMQVAADDTLICECGINANGDFSIQKVDDGEGDSCEVFKRWRSLMAEVATAQGLVVMDEQGKIVESSKQKKSEEVLQSMAVSDVML